MADAIIRLSQSPATRLSAVRKIADESLKAVYSALSDKHDCTLQLALLHAIGAVLKDPKPGGEEALCNWVAALLVQLEDSPLAAVCDDIPSAERACEEIAKLQALLGVPPERRASVLERDDSAGPTPFGVTGWAASDYDQDVPAVVVNSNATPLQLVSWAIGHLEQVTTLTRIIGAATRCDTVFEPSEVCGAIRHPTEQALAVLHAAAGRLFSRSTA